MRIISLYFSVLAIVYSLNAFAQQELIAVQNGEILEQPLSFIPLETINLLKEPPINTQLWQHKDPQLSQDLLMALPITPVQFNDLKLHALEAPIYLERSTPEASTQLRNIRLYHLALSDYDSFIGYFAHIPEKLHTEITNRYRLLALFFSQQTALACETVSQELTTNMHDFWLHALLYCQAYHRQDHALSLSLKLIKEDKKTLPTELEALLSYAQSPTRDEALLQAQWIRFLAQLLTPHTLSPVPLPSAPNIDSPFLSRSQLHAAWPSTDSDSNTALERMSGLLNMIHSNGQTIAFSQWNQLWLYALSHQIRPPELLIRHYLLSALDTQQRSVAWLALTYILTSYPLDHSGLLVSDLIYSLRFLGFESEAEMLTRTLISQETP